MIIIRKLYLIILLSTINYFNSVLKSYYTVLTFLVEGMKIPTFQYDYLLSVAFESGNLFFIKMLIEKKNLDPSKDNNRFIIHALKENHIGIVDYLLQNEKVKKRLLHDLDKPEYIEQLKQVLNNKNVYKYELNGKALRIVVKYKWNDILDKYIKWNKELYGYLTNISNDNSFYKHYSYVDPYKDEELNRMIYSNKLNDVTFMKKWVELQAFVLKYIYNQ